MNLNSFKTQAMSVHKGKYSYDSVVWKNKTTPRDHYLPPARRLRGKAVATPEGRGRVPQVQKAGS